MSIWATRAERDAEFNRHFVSYDFLVRDEFDNGEFLTSATVDLIENGKVVHTETFTASSEDAPGEAFSAYGNGRDNHAGTPGRLVCMGVGRVADDDAGRSPRPRRHRVAARAGRARRGVRMTAKLAHGDTVTLRYASKRKVEATVEDIDVSFPVLARAGQSYYFLYAGGNSRKINVSSDGGSILEIGYNLGTWEVAA